MKSIICSLFLTLFFFSAQSQTRYYVSTPIDPYEFDDYIMDHCGYPGCQRVVCIDAQGNYVGEVTEFNNFGEPFQGTKDLEIDYSRDKLWIQPRFYDLDNWYNEDFVGGTYNSNGHVAIDEINRKIYKAFTSSIVVTDYDGNVTSTIPLSNQFVQGIEIDMVNQVLYYTAHYSLNSKLYAYDINAGTTQVLINTLSSSAGLALDIPRNKIYYISGHSIYSCDLEGNNSQSIVDLSIFSDTADLEIDFAEQKLVWFTGYEIEKSDFDGSNRVAYSVHVYGNDYGTMEGGIAIENIGCSPHRALSNNESGTSASYQTVNFIHSTSTIDQGADVNYESDMIILESGFEVKLGATFLGDINPCGS